MDPERLKGNLDVLLLSVLSSDPAHGYAIISALRGQPRGGSALGGGPHRREPGIGTAAKPGA
jgi:hypothetical protein